MLPVAGFYKDILEGVSLKGRVCSCVHIFSKLAMMLLKVADTSSVRGMAKNLRDLLVFIKLHNCYSLQQPGVTGINMYLDGGNTKTMLTFCSLNMKT